ncbi:acyl-CoA synthetase [Natronobiforma cellulositropha]|uniref:acyl-CoA synthetase n=1 Tax=Natronobiforma cellulositropha TaxID=1679076 RepID=UPI0021D56FAA|nr:benzoate-CoA ligase family protein [Natronobiforma cellulositropha]
MTRPLNPTADGTERPNTTITVDALVDSGNEVFGTPELHYPKRINAADVMVDDHVRGGRGDSVAIYFEDEEITYGELHERTNRLGNALRDLGVRPGNRVFVRFPNRPEYVVACLAIQKVGAIPVPSMKLLQTTEVEYVLNDSGARFAVVYEDLLGPVEEADAAGLEEVLVVETSDTDHDYLSYADVVDGQSTALSVQDTHRDDFALLAYTSGTTGQPKGTVHTHRQLLSITDAYARNCLEPTADDVFGGNPPIAFTFGYGLLVAFPFRFGASTCLVEDQTPEALLEAVDEYGISIIGSVPTAYNQMLALDAETTYDLSSLRTGISAGEPLPSDTYDRVLEEFGIELLDGIGTTEMLHIFISDRASDEVDPTATGYPVPGYECKVADPETGEELDRGEPGVLMVRGPTTVSYWNRSDKQLEAVHDGWSIPGDIFVHREDGRFVHQSRRDDLIITSGYNVPGPQVEEVLQELDTVRESAVVASPDEIRGTIVKAFVVLADGTEASEDLTDRLQTYVKGQIAPYKYPREIEYVDDLPMTESGKIQRAKLREREYGDDGDSQSPLIAD